VILPFDDVSSGNGRDIAAPHIVQPADIGMLLLPS
jgi:hypothetical protein